MPGYVFHEWSLLLPLQLSRVGLDKSISEKVTGLSFQLVMDLETYQKFNSENSPYGLNLYIHPQDTLPGRKQFKILSGYRRLIGFSQTRHVFHKPSRNCRDTDMLRPIFDPVLEKTRDMIIDSVDVCRLLVSQEYFYRHCHCFSPFLPVPKIDSVANTRLCLNMSEYSNAQIVKNSRWVDLWK